jgi:GNAT superfamily N-acetyltransferase
LEHRPLTIQEARDLSAANLIETYLALAKPMPDATIYRSDSFSYCIGDYPHPICNFGIVTEPDPEAVREAARLGKERPFFNLYHPNADPSKAEPFYRFGFDIAYRLVEMMAPPDPIGSSTELVPAIGDSDRFHIASFMTDQFFSSHSHELRRRIAAATASASGLSLQTLSLLPDFPTAAVMLHEVGESLGLYNLCVQPAFRRQGNGQKVVEWVRSKAYQAGKPVVLQCDPRLQDWYERLGFDAVGDLEVWTIRKSLI